MSCSGEVRSAFGRMKSGGGSFASRQSSHARDVPNRASQRRISPTGNESAAARCAADSAGGGRTFFPRTQARPGRTSKEHCGWAGSGSAAKRRSRADRAQDGVDEAGRARFPRRAGEPHRFVHDRVLRDALEEEHLVNAQPQHLPDRRVELVQRPRRIRREHRVERRQPPDDAVRQVRRQPPVLGLHRRAREALGEQLAGERLAGGRERLADDLERAAPRIGREAARFSAGFTRHGRNLRV